MTQEPTADAYAKAILDGVEQLSRAPGMSPAALVQVCAAFQRSLILSGKPHLAGTAMKLAPFVEQVVQDQRMSEFGWSSKLRLLLASGTTRLSDPACGQSF